MKLATASFTLKKQGETHKKETKFGRTNLMGMILQSVKDKFVEKLNPQG